MTWALIEGGKVIQLSDEKFDVNDALNWAASQDGTLLGDSYDGTSFARPVPPSTITPAGPRYIPLSTIRDRVTAAGRWTEFAGALDSLSPDKRWHLLTLTEGVASDDPDATALLTAVGCDPAAILA